MTVKQVAEIVIRRQRDRRRLVRRHLVTMATLIAEPDHLAGRSITLLIRRGRHPASVMRRHPLAAIASSLLLRRAPWWWKMKPAHTQTPLPPGADFLHRCHHALSICSALARQDVQNRSSDSISGR